MDFPGNLLHQHHFPGHLLHQHHQQQQDPSGNSGSVMHPLEQQQQDLQNHYQQQQQLMHASTGAATHLNSHLSFSQQSSPLHSPSTASLLSPFSKLSFSSSSTPQSPLAPMTPGGSGPDKFHPRGAAVVVGAWPADRDFGEFWALLRRRLPGFERMIVGSDDTLAVLLTSTETASHALTHIRASGAAYSDMAAADILILPPPPRIAPPSALPSKELVVTSGGYFTDRILEVSEGFAGWRDDPSAGAKVAVFADAAAAARCVDDIARYSNLGVDFWRDRTADEMEYVNANAAAAAAAERWGRSSLDGNPASVAGGGGGEKWGRGSIDSERWETASIGSQKSGISNPFPASPNRSVGASGVTAGGPGIRTIYVTSLGTTDKCDIKNFCSSLPGFYRVQFGQTNFRVVLTDPEKAIAAMSVIQSTFKGMKATFARKEPEVKIIEELGESSRVLWTSTLYWGEAECRKFMAQLEGFEKLVFDAAHSWVHFRDVECARRALVELNTTTNLYSVFSKKFDKDGMATGALPIGSSNSNNNGIMAAGNGLLGVAGGVGGGLGAGLGGTRLGSRSSSAASVVSNTGSVKYPLQQQQQQQQHQLAAAAEALAFQQHQQSWIATQVQQEQTAIPGGSLVGVPLKMPPAAATGGLSLSAANSPVLNPAAFADVSPSLLRIGSSPASSSQQPTPPTAGSISLIEKLSSSPRPTPLARMQTSLRRMASHSGFLSSSSSSAPGSPLAGKFDFGKPVPATSGSVPRPAALASSIASGVETPPTTPKEMIFGEEEEGPSSSSSPSLLSFHPHLQQPIRFGSVPLPPVGASSSILGGSSLAYGVFSDEPENDYDVPAAVSNLARELEGLDVYDDESARRNGDVAESGFGMARRMWPRTQSTPEVSLSLSSLPVGTPPNSRPLIPPPGASPATAPLDSWPSPRLPPAPGTPVFSSDPVGVGSGSPLLSSATWGSLPAAASSTGTGIGLGSSSSFAQSAWATGGSNSHGGATGLGGSTSLGRSNTLGTASDYWSPSGAKRSPLGAFSHFVSPSGAGGTKLKRERSVDSFRSEPGVLLRSDRWVGGSGGLGSLDDELEPGYSAAQSSSSNKVQPSPLGAVLMAARMGSSGSLSSISSSTGASVARASRFDPEAKEFVPEWSRGDEDGGDVVEEDEDDDDDTGRIQSTSTLDGATLFDNAGSGDRDDAVLGELVDAARRLAGRLKVDLAPDAGEAVTSRAGRLAFLKRWFERVEAGVASN
ncbi:hypothetical protein DFJ73DRAFT_148057 [Zopfochytrium polystomum]|nr:hypothetical protein DFJ73DRAFT_148057 [Zopfochytrium polystomum]